MHEGAAPPDSPAMPQQQDAPRNFRGYFGDQQHMATGRAAATPAQENPPMEPTNDMDHSSPVETRIRQESSDDDDVPLRDRRLCDYHQQPTSTMAIQERLGFQKSAKASPFSTAKTHKKPGPKPWAAKPIAKNDMKAKMEVIRAIEKNWGKNFIRDYIPKCHRPLQKKKGGKRTAFRQHEMDPKKWLPSVLKSLLGISYLTTDKAFLKKAMNDIVRHRIKHTGNRKPQLVTTDFDVIEDMITRGWDIETSFSIRYKHLLLANPKGYLETDEDIDHILACGDDEYQRSSDLDHEDEDDDDDDMEVHNQEEEDTTNFSGPYAGIGGYIHGSPHQPPKMIVPKHPKRSKPIKKEKQEKPMKPAKATKRSALSKGSPDNQAPQHLPPHMYGGYGMPVYGPYGAFPGYPPMPGYAPPDMKGFPLQPPYGKGYPPMPPMFPWTCYGQQEKDGKIQDPQAAGYPPYGFPGHAYGQQPDKDGDTQDSRAQTHGNPPYGYGYLGMPSYPPPMSPSPNLPRSTPAPSAPARPSGLTRFSPFDNSKRSASRRADPSVRHHDAAGYTHTPYIKREPGVEDHPIAIEDYDNGPSNDLGEAVEDSQDGDQEALDEIAEQERHIQMLRARLAKKKSRG
ncbi:uncharacterized protein CC84DRAFT_1222324 [Paraphaeosphaeria sporulosa]|uniref:Uncharacterized protein n=1 Tax=Paraphaeosphaeria sporulosa TaxID=1460663 RepID=A0A177BYF8_9PLEO|nr:uncharacterized protein CC84DRAFT_1222324 [Paraphaeosphaeria sporulosa]OAF99990.1 hypothetical protein CC84DRAFT_1222324 [Paraphaeosphaeria sporulosa]